MNSVIVDIQKKLNEGLYKNEEQIRFSLISRVLNKLDWDIWNPQEVYTEFSPDDGRNRVDIALFITPQYPSIFIEIKAHNKLYNEAELNKAENQLRDYNVNLTALFTILTDGNQWRFYYSQEGGTFSQKCFKIINLQTDDIDDIELSFLTFLAKNEIISGNAKNEASSYLQMSRKQQIIEGSISAAKREQENNPFLSLADSIYNVVLQKIEITEDEIIDFLKSESSKKMLNKIVSKPVITPYEDDLKNIRYFNKKRQYTISNPLDLAFTKISSGEINGEYGNNWQNLLRIFRVC